MSTRKKTPRTENSETLTALVAEGKRPSPPIMPVPPVEPPVPTYKLAKVRGDRGKEYLVFPYLLQTATGPRNLEITVSGSCDHDCNVRWVEVAGNIRIRPQDNLLTVLTIDKDGIVVNESTEKRGYRDHYGFNPMHPPCMWGPPPEPPKAPEKILDQGKLISLISDLAEDIMAFHEDIKALAALRGAKSNYENSMYQYREALRAYNRKYGIKETPKE